MKRRMVLCLLMVGFVVSGCSDDNPASAEKTLEEIIIGTWEKTNSSKYIVTCRYEITGIYECWNKNTSSRFGITA